MKLKIENELQTMQDNYIQGLKKSIELLVKNNDVNKIITFRLPRRTGNSEIALRMFLETENSCLIIRDYYQRTEILNRMFTDVYMKQKYTIPKNKKEKVLLLSECENKLRGNNYSLYIIDDFHSISYETIGMTIGAMAQTSNSVLLCIG